MKPTELARQCLKVIQQQPSVPFIVVIGKLPVKGWPRGKCIGSDSKGRFYSYDAWKLLAKLIEYGAVKAERVNATTVTIDIEGEVYTLSSESQEKVTA